MSNKKDKDNMNATTGQQVSIESTETLHEEIATLKKSNAALKGINNNLRERIERIRAIVKEYNALPWYKRIFTQVILD